MANLPGGKNQARRTYGYIRPPKQEIVVVVNGASRSFDAQSMAYHRDFFRVINDALQSTAGGPSPIAFGEYDEDLISFNWTTSGSRAFNITFTATPIVVLDVIPNTDLENINVFLSYSSPTNLSVQVSAPFSGSVRYRAIYSPTYPIMVTRNVISSAFTYNAYAGYIDLVGINFFTASYTSFGSPPSQAWFTPYDINGNNGASVALVGSSSYGLTSSSGDISSAIVDRINFLVVA